MTRRSDHRLIRRDLSCPLCNAYKAGGKVVCDDCHLDIESGTPDWAGEVEDRLDAAESLMEANEILGVW